MSDIQTSERRPPLPVAAFSGLCPRCSAKTLFRGWVQFSDSCPACKLDIAGFNVGDGPAAFLTMIVGAVVLFLALALDFAAHPPFWVHLIIWVPLTALLTAVSLRMAKGMLLHIEYRRDAREAGGGDAG